MSYGIYLSASGVVSASHRQDVIANNLANVETAGFKRSLAVFRERRAEDKPGDGIRGLSGGLLVAPSRLDVTQGALEETNNPLDVALHGAGYLAVQQPDGSLRLTRDGRTAIDRDGYLVSASDGVSRVLDTKQRSILIHGFPPSILNVDRAGRILIKGTSESLGQIGVFALPAGAAAIPDGRSRLVVPAAALPRGDAEVRGGMVERSNVDPATEMVRLMEAQRQLDANANLIRFQDEATGRLVGEVGKIG